MTESNRGDSSQSFNAASVRGCLAAGDLIGAARREADAAGMDGYDVTADLLRRLADQLEDSRAGLRYIAQRYGRLDGVGWERVL